MTTFTEYTFTLRSSSTLVEHAEHDMAQWSASTFSALPSWADRDASGLICHTCHTVYVDAVSDETHVRGNLDSFAAAVVDVNAAALQIERDATDEHAARTYRDGLRSLVRLYRNAYSGDLGSTSERLRVADSLGELLEAAASRRLS